MTHRKPRRWTWAPLLLLCAVGAGVTAHAVANPSVSVAQWTPPVHKTVQRVTEVPRKLPVISTLVNYDVRKGDTLWSIATSQCGNPLDWGMLQKFNHISGITIHQGEVITLKCH